MTRRTLQWTATSGQEIEFALHTDYELDDQGRRRTRGYKEVVIEATIDGTAELGYLQPIESSDKFVARYGRIGLTRERHESLMALIDELRAGIKDHNDAVDAKAARLDAVEDDRRQMEHAMACGD